MPLSHLPECTADLCVCAKPKPKLAPVVIGLLPLLAVIGGFCLKGPMSWV